MVPLRRAAAVSVLGLVLASCGVVGPSAAGDSGTDRQSRTLAMAIAYPRQEDAAGFARAALTTTLGKSGTFAVLEATDLEHKDPQQPMARLVWRIHQDAMDAGFSATPAFDACYTVEFNYYEASSGPDRVTCPENAIPFTPPPLPKRGVPDGAHPALEAVLGALPAAPVEADVRAAVVAALPKPVDPETGLASIPPQVFVQVTGADAGVALFARTGVESKECTLGRRRGGVVQVWSLNHRDLVMREMSCSAEAALAT